MPQKTSKRLFSASTIAVIVVLVIAGYFLKTPKESPSGEGSLNVLESGRARTWKTFIDEKHDISFRYPILQNVAAKPGGIFSLAQGNSVLKLQVYEKGRFSIPKGNSSVRTNGNTMTEETYFENGKYQFMLSIVTKCFGADCVEGAESPDDKAYEDSLQYLHDAIVETINL